MTRTRPAAVLESSPSGLPPLDLVVFTVIVDDLVFADGATRMGVLGGGGPQTAFGFRTHPGDLTVGLAAGVGPDFPRECADWLDANGVDTEGLMLVRDDGTDTSGTVEREEDDAHEAHDEDGSSWEGGGASASSFIARRAQRKRDEEDPTPRRNDETTFRPTPRAWQITEHDGRRTQVWRTPANAGLYAMLRPPAETLPPRYRGARAFHVGVHPERPDTTLLASLCSLGARADGDGNVPWISVEPFTRATRPVSRETLQTLCSAGHVFSPNELEAVSLVGEGSPVELCRRLAAAGARIVCVRRGEKGAVVHDAETGETWRVPAFLEDQSLLADVTGCGNAFCGGFMAGLVSGESLERAACWGSAAASVVAEHVGVPAVPAGDSGVRGEVRRRFEALLRRTVKIVEHEQENAHG